MKTYVEKEVSGSEGILTRVDHGRGLGKTGYPVW